MRDNYAFKPRLTCVLPHIMGSAWCNLNFKPLLLFGFKSVLRTGESEGEGKLARKEWGGGAEEKVRQPRLPPRSPQYSSFSGSNFT